MKRLYIFVCSAIALTGCMSREYMEIFDFPEEKWNKNQSVVFTFRPLRPVVTENGSESVEWMDIVVRHRDDFPYTDLLLEIKGIRPDKVFWMDTVQVRLAERSAERDGEYHWVGQRYSNHYELTRRYRDRIQYQYKADSLGRITGDYELSIRQVNSNDLNGILSIGIVASGCQGANTEE